MRSLAILLPLLLLTGCFSSEPPGAPEQALATALSEDAHLVEPAVATSLPAARSLAAPPTWQSGEWWRIQITEHMSGQSFEVTRVVAGVEGDHYLVGMPSDAFVDAAMVLHLPGFGLVGRQDLSYEIHDSVFAPVRFPLDEGASWETEFEGWAMTATVVRASGGVAEIDMEGDGGTLRIVYDAAVGEVTSLQVEGYLEYEVVEHGFGHQGVVTVPHMNDVVFNTFRAASPRIGDDLGSPLETITVDETYERVSFALLVGAYIPDGRTITSGVFRERATAPDGTSYEIMITPLDAPGEHIAFFGNSAPGGDWTFEHAPAGGGYVLAEGIAYHVYEVDLPSGRMEGLHEHPGEEENA